MGTSSRGRCRRTDLQKGLEHLLFTVFSTKRTVIKHTRSAPTTAVLRDNSQSPHLSDSDGQLPFSLVAEEQLEITDYARQLSTQLGAKFKPVSCKQQSGTQACFCFPHWSQTSSSLTKQYHLPGTRLTAFEVGQHVTWWCVCCHSLESARSSFANTDFPDLPSDWLEGMAEKVCTSQGT